MIDTIVLLLNIGMFYISQPDKFTPSARWLTDQTDLGSRGNIASKQNPTKEQQLTRYRPRLTLYKRDKDGGYEVTLKIELSLQKFYNNGQNFDEILDDNFESIVADLKLELSKMGVEVRYEALYTAPVSAIHYAKNIPLTDGTTPYHYIQELRKTNISRWLDMNQTDYRNEGHSFKFRANSYEVAFYDKLLDPEIAKKSPKRAIEQGYYTQLPLLETLKSLPSAKKPEVLRFEYRFNKRQKIKSVLKALGLEREATFDKLFSLEVAKTVLLSYLDEIERRRPVLLDYKVKTPEGLLADLIINNPGLGPRKTLQLFGMKQAFDAIGMREVRAMLVKYSDRSWYRLVSESKGVKLPIKRDLLTLLRKQIEAFVPLKLTDYTQNDN